EQSKTERKWAKQDREHFQPANYEEDEDHQHFDDAGRFTFWSKQMFQKSANTVGLKRPDKPQDKENSRHRRGHIEIGISTAQKRPIDMKRADRWVVMSPADRSDAGNQAEPIHEQNENENRREKPKRFPHQLAPDD